MKQITTEPIVGFVSPGSELKLAIEDLYIGSKKQLIITYGITLNSNKDKSDIVTSYTLESFDLKLSINDKVVAVHPFHINLLDYLDKEFSYSIDLMNEVTETHFIKVEIDNIKNNKIQYANIKESYIAESTAKSRALIKLKCEKDNFGYKFSYRTNLTPDARVFMKLNNNNWREINDSVFTLQLDNNIAYIQLYTLDEENQRVYSNIIRIINGEITTL